MEPVHPKLTIYGVEQGYNNVTINYFQTAVVKQYKIDDGGWQNYTGPVKLIASHKLTARSIDKYNVVSQEKECISEVSDDIIGPNAYDGDETTYYQYGKDNSIVTGKILNIDESMHNQKFRLNAKFTT